jgi:hypothetical protein
MPETLFHEGDRVKFHLGVRWVRGTITEDRGPIGIKGRRLYRVEFRDDQSIAHIELPAEDLQLVNGAATTK